MRWGRHGDRQVPPGSGLALGVVAMVALVLAAAAIYWIATDLLR